MGLPFSSFYHTAEPPLRMLRFFVIDDDIVLRKQFSCTVHSLNSCRSKGGV